MTPFLFKKIKNKKLENYALAILKLKLFDYCIMKAQGIAAIRIDKYFMFLL